MVESGRAARAGRHPAFVSLKEAQQVDRRVVDGEVLVVAGRDPRVVVQCGGLQGPGQFGIAGDVVGHGRHAAGQFVRRVAAGPTGVGGHHHLDQGEPVGVEHHVGVGTQRVETLGPEPFQTGDEVDFHAVVEFQTDLGGKDDGWDVGHHGRSDDLTHGSAPFRPPPGREARPPA